MATDRPGRANGAAGRVFGTLTLCRGFRYDLHRLMAKRDSHIDVLVLGDHPAAYLAAALLAHKSKETVLHSTIPHRPSVDRLVMINPAFFDLHPLLEGTRRRIHSRSVYGLQFLADDPAIRTEHRARRAVGCVAQLRDVRAAMESLARSQGVAMVNPRNLEIHRVDEHGVEVTVGNQLLTPKALILGGQLPPAQQRILGLPEEWEGGVLRRYSHARIRGTRAMELGGRPLVPMSLDLRGLLVWAWLFPGEAHLQFAIDQPMDQAQRIAAHELLSHWAAVLHRHGILRSPVEITPDMVVSEDLPLAGALAHEGIASRTLLVGPAGGFYTASAEDVYPNCWSAIYAAEVLKKALKERHLQDAIQPYRQRWRTTLGDYLRGPHQNLRYLLPLVYRNQVMTSRVAEAILTGRSVVR